MINEQLARGSNYAVQGAMLVYTIAFFMYIAEWVFGSRSRFVLTETVADGGAAVLVGASVGTSVGASIGAPVGGRPRGGVRDQFQENLGDEPDPTVHNGDFRADKWGRMAISLSILGFVLHSAAVLLRGLAAHRAPWGNLYEFSVAGSCVAMALYLLLLWKKDARWLGLFVTGTIVLILGVAYVLLYKDAEQLVPALHSYWLAIHVTAAVICSGLFTVASVTTVLYLFKANYEKRAKIGTARPGSVWERVPSAMRLDLTAYRILAFAFPVWTFTVIAGSIWAERAWGRYWGWDPTETWAFITWVTYAAYLHARATMGWKGRNAAIIALLGYGAFIFNYFIVSLFVNGMHSYAGV